MGLFLGYTFTGLFLGAAYAIAASGLVLTYTTTRVFNLAHGATSMIMAFVYWELHVHDHLPTLPSVALVLFVIAPLYGIAIERVVMRGVADAPVGVSLVVTVAMFVFLVGVAQTVWPANEVHNVDYFFGYDAVTILGTSISYHFALTIVVSALVAAGLYVLLRRTRIGTAMRASVDNRDLLQMFGARATRVSQLSWALGSSLAALAGILLAPYTGLDYYVLTFLVIASFAAAMLGRLSSLPLTFFGAIALGLATAYVQGYVRTNSALVQTGLQGSLPTFMLFATLVFVPQVRLRVGQVRGIMAANVPSRQRTVGFSLALIAGSAAVLPLLDATHTLRFGLAVSYALVMLSLVLLTGYGGHVSLAQFSFVGVGAAVAAKMDSTSPMVLLLAVLISAAVGLVVALPVLRLTGLYLALATLAFGQLMDKLVFQSDLMFGYGSTLAAKRVSLLGYDFGNTRAYVLLMVVVFTLIATVLLAVRRGPVGRLLIALRDSPAACGTLGLNQRWFRLALFSGSAGIAGLAGALLAGLEGSVSATPFNVLQSLPLLLIAVVAGVTTITGAFLGGLLLMLLPVLQATVPSLSGLEFLIIAVGAILLARDPNGLANVFFKGVRASLPHLPLAERLQAGGSEQAQRAETEAAGHGAA